DRLPFVSEVVLHFGNRIESTALRLRILSRSCRPDSFTRIIERILLIADFNVGEGNGVGRSGFFDEITRVAPIRQRLPETVNRLKHRFACVLPEKHRALCKFARSSDPSLVSLRRGLRTAEHDFVAAVWSMRLGRGDLYSVDARSFCDDFDDFGVADTEA